MLSEGAAGRRCLPTEVVAAEAVLAAVDGAVAVVAFLQVGSPLVLEFSSFPALAISLKNSLHRQWLVLDVHRRGSLFPRS